jgi:hypothetical protein
MAQQQQDFLPDNVSLREQLVRESIAMAKYAFASAKAVSGNIIQIIEHFANDVGILDIAQEDIKGLTAQQKDDEKTSSEYIGQEGKLTIKTLIIAHERLTRIVEPATPRTILLMDQEKRRKGKLAFLGPVPFIRRMMMAAIICLLLFITISLSPDINNEPDAWNLYKLDGLALLLKELFLICSAGLGASFTALFRANRFIVEGTFDPKHESSYWIRFTLGLIAGMLLATLIPIEEMQVDYGKPLMAMLGGFSVDLVYRIINRLLETLESLFRGDTKTLVKTKGEQAKLKMTEEESKNRFKAASNIMKIQQEIDSGMKPEEVKQKMGKLMDNLVQIDSEEDLA